MRQLTRFGPKPLNRAISAGRDPRPRIAIGVGVGRVLVGASFLANPVASVRFLGVDTATATRLQWLARMTAARDAALGFGTLASGLHRRGMNGWLLAGAACDVVDGLVIADAARRGQLSALPAAVVTAAAAAGTAIAIGAILGGPRCGRPRDHTSRIS